MTRYILRRLISVFPTLLGVTFVIFMFQRLIPGDPAVAMLGEHASQANVERIREQLGLNRPLFLDREALAQGELGQFFDSQYIRYLGRLIRLDLGNSIHRRIPVAETLAIRFPATVELALLSLLISILVGIPVGIASAARRNTALDGVSMIGSLIGVSMPIFWLGLMEIMLFAVILQWLPAGGRFKYRSGDREDHGLISGRQPVDRQYPRFHRCAGTYHHAGDCFSDHPYVNHRPDDPFEHVGCASGRLYPHSHRKRPGRAGGALPACAQERLFASNHYHRHPSRHVDGWRGAYRDHLFLAWDREMGL